MHLFDAWLCTLQLLNRCNECIRVPWMTQGREVCGGIGCWEHCAATCIALTLLGLVRVQRIGRKLLSFVIGLAASVRTGWAGCAVEGLGCLGQGPRGEDDEENRRREEGRPKT